MEKKLDTVKDVVKIGAGMGIMTITNNIVKQSTSEEKGIGKKVTIWMGGLVLGGMVCKKAYDYIEEQFDEFTKRSKKKEVVEEKQEEQKVD